MPFEDSRILAVQSADTAYEKKEKERRKKWFLDAQFCFSGLAFLRFFGHDIEAAWSLINERVAQPMGLTRGISVEHAAEVRDHLTGAELNEMILQAGEITAIHEVNKRHDIKINPSVQELLMQKLFDFIRNIMRYNIKDPVQRMKHLFHSAEQLEEPMVVIHINVLTDLEIALQKNALERTRKAGKITEEEYEKSLSEIPSPEQMEAQLRNEDLDQDTAFERAFAYLSKMQHNRRNRKTVRIAFENTVLARGKEKLTFFENPAELVRILKARGEEAKDMGVTLDGAHLAITNKRLHSLELEELNASEIIEAISKRLFNVHLNGYEATNQEQTKFEDGIPMHKSENRQFFQEIMRALCDFECEVPLVFELNPFGEHFGVKNNMFEKLLSCIKRPIKRGVLGEYLEEEIQAYIKELLFIQQALGIKQEEETL